MKIAIRLLLVVVYGAVSVRCTTENPIIVPRLLPPISGLAKIPEATKPVMDGVYRVVRGSERFGEQVVVKWRGDRLSIFSNNNYIVLPTGFKDSTIFLQGYWRNPQSDAAGLASFAIAKTEGARNLLKGLPNTNTQIKGVYGNGNAAPNQEFTLQYLRPFSAEVKSKDFFVVAHRAGGRTSDRLPASENSIRMIDFTEHLGSNGIEIDIRLTKDKVPVLYHDEDINIRLTIKGPLNGNINSFTYAQINTFVWLIRGEKIPKLEEALDFVVDSTKLEFVWLDMKAEEGLEAISYVKPIQERILKKALSKGRKLEVFMGVPSQDIYNGLLATPGFEAIPSLCELSPDQARALNAKVWGPRWTLGTQNDLVLQMQAEGRKVICWTIDVPAFIRQYINEGEFDGLLTNYPSLVTYYHYILQ